MKVGILTLHRAVNEGSLLQACTTYQILKKLLPQAKVEIIDYQSKAVHQTESQKIFDLWPPRFSPPQLKKRNELRKFLKKHAALSEQRCQSDDVEVASDFVNQQSYDVICVGSDTIWNCADRNYFPPPPNIFFLSGIHGAVKVAFAASSDRGRIADLPPEIRTQCAEAISDFDFISVRDEGTRKDLVTSGIEDSRIHFLPDPTLLHPTNHHSPNNVSSSPSVAVALSDRVWRNELCRRIQSKGWKVSNLLGTTPPGCNGRYRELPMEKRLGAFRDFQFVITDRFHVSLFSLQFSNCPVAFIESSDRYPETSETGKGRDLFRRLGIEEMVFSGPPGETIPSTLIDDCLSNSAKFSWPRNEAIRKLKSDGNTTLMWMQQAMLKRNDAG